MIDSIGLGGFLAHAIVLFSLGVTFLGWVIFYKMGYQYASKLWLSCSLNVTAFLYFLGTTSYIISIFCLVLWPIINLFLIIWYVWKKKR